MFQITTESSHKHNGNLDLNLKGSHSHSISHTLEGLHHRLHDRLREHSASNSENYQSQRQSSGKLNANLNLAGNRTSQLGRGKHQSKKENNRQEINGTPEDDSVNDENEYIYT